MIEPKPRQSTTHGRPLIPILDPRALVDIAVREYFVKARFFPSLFSLEEAVTRDALTRAKLETCDPALLLFD